MGEWAAVVGNDNKLGNSALNDDRPKPTLPKRWIQTCIE